MARINTQENRKVWKQINESHRRSQRLWQYGLLLFAAALIVGLLIVAGLTEPPKP